jgi:hypothetical protein
MLPSEVAQMIARARSAEESVSRIFAGNFDFDHFNLFGTVD